MGVTKAMTIHLAIFTTCPELGYLLPETSISSSSSSRWLGGGSILVSRKETAEEVSCISPYKYICIYIHLWASLRR